MITASSAPASSASQGICMNPAIAGRAIARLFLDRSDREPEKLALRYKKLGIWREVTWGDYRNSVECTALGLLRLGVRPGDRIAVMGPAIPEWLYVDLAAQSIGAVPVGLFLTTPADELERQLARSGARVFVTTSFEFVDRLLEAERLAGTQLVDHIVVASHLSPLGPQTERLIELDELDQWGAEDLAGNAGKWQGLVEERHADEAIRLYFTAGTTGAPKGILLSSRNLTGPWVDLFSELSSPPGPHDRSVAYMPTAHVGETVFSVVLPIVFGTVPHFPEDEDAVGEALIEVSPTLLLAFPRVLELYASNALIDLETGSGLKRRLYRLATRLRRGSSGAGRVGSWISYQLLFRHLLNKFGFQKVRFGLTGGAAVSPDLLRLWDQWGLQLTEFYGLTEAGGLVTVTRPGSSGSVAAPGVDLHLAEDGEVWVRGPGVFMAYLDGEKDPATVDDEGWLHTGDIGMAADGGGVRILGRKQDMFCTAAGAMVHPAELENALKYGPYIRDAMVLDRRQTGLVALLGMDLDNVALWARGQAILFTSASELISEPKVLALVESVVDEANQRLADSGSPHQIVDFRLLPAELEAGDEMTPTRTIRRSRVLEKFSALIEEM